MKQQPIKVIIQIPCYNEAETLPITIPALPRNLPGVESVEFLLVDDGSTDGSAEIAAELGVDYIVRLKSHKGLAASFVAGLDASLKRGADIIVNTDADNQYHAGDIEKLIQPILEGKAQIVIGDRGVASLEHFSAAKRSLQRLGSWVISKASGLNIPDATSGFRAFSREAALRTIVLSEYTYTLETLIQAGVNDLEVAFVPVKTNPKTRDSRLIHSTREYLLQSASTVLRMYSMYRPLRVFSIISLVMVSAGLALGIRFIYFFAIGQGSGHIQSLILTAVLLILGFQVFLIGLIADLVNFNRRLIEEILIQLRRQNIQPHPQEEGTAEP